MSIKISACIIAKNEEYLIEDCLKSIISVVDEIIVLDTGSNDKTVEIASNYASVFHYKWNGDSSDARNKSLSYATGDWLLILDADERLTNFTQKNLRFYLENNLIEPNSILMFNYHNMNPYSLDKSYFKATMLKNNSNIKYLGVTHEFPVNELEQLQLIFLENFEVIHLNGNSKEQLINKAKIYINLISKQIDNELDSYQNHYFYKQLSNDYFVIEEYVKAIENYYNSIKIIIKHNKLLQDKEFCLNISQTIIKNLIHLKQDFKKSIEISSYILDLFNDITTYKEVLEIKYYLGYSLFYNNEYDKCLAVYLEIKNYFLGIKPDDSQKNMIISVYLGIARCYLLNKNYDLSFEYFKELQIINKNSSELILLHLTRYYLLINEFEKALELYNKVSQSNTNYSKNDLKFELIKYNIWSAHELEQLKNFDFNNK